MPMNFEYKKLDKKTKMILTVLLVLSCIAVTYMLDKGMIGTSYTVRIVRISVIYALIGVSMNLVNGFTGVFSLGQAGFMAIGAYSVGVFTIPIEARANVFYLVPMSDKIANV
jgi:branched-chain amino acid transport system permease protein